MEVQIEIFFLIVLLLGFVTEYSPPNQTKPERDLTKIALNYIRTTRFKMNLISILPFMQVLNFKNMRLLYFLKCSRMSGTFELLDTKHFMHEVRLYHGKIIKKKCEDPKIANDNEIDHCQTMNKIILFYTMKIFKLSFSIFLTCYYLGIFFYIFCDLTSYDKIIGNIEQI